jgi:hypothetical protein
MQAWLFGGLQRPGIGGRGGKRVRVAYFAAPPTLSKGCRWADCLRAMQPGEMVIGRDKQNEFPSLLLAVLFAAVGMD